MTVKQLKELIADWPDDENVLVWDDRWNMYVMLFADDIVHSSHKELN